jgi:transposase
MKKTNPISHTYKTEIPETDWEQTPASVKARMEEMGEWIEALEEKLNRTSNNSSSPPSTDPLNAEKKKAKKKSGKKRGGQLGHKGFGRVLYDESECQEIIDYKPEACSGCGAKLEGEDANPHRHQHVEIPPIEPIVIEHRLHRLECEECGRSTRAKLPLDVEPNHYGVRVVAIIAVLSGLYRHSQRMIQTAMQEIFNIRISLGTISKLRIEASTAVESAVEEAKNYVQNAAIVGADETSFSQGNMDGCNSQNSQAWLWVAVTPLVTFFQITLTRCTNAAKNLLGEAFDGILNSDRYAAYNWVNTERRQLCWAHLTREFIKISERMGVSQQIGTALLEQQEKLFALWYQVRDGTLARSDFQSAVEPIRNAVKSILKEATNYEIGTKENTPLAKTVRTCRQLLKFESALWLFVSVENVEPTNNAAERAVRPVVILRRTSFGSQTEAGSNFVARMLTVITTLKSQRRNVLEFLTSAIKAAREGKSSPSLLPQIPPAE